MWSRRENSSTKQGERKGERILELNVKFQDLTRLSVLQYSILFFLGVVGMEIKQVNTAYLVLAYGAVILTSAFGLVIALHHRRRQKEKFEIIAAHEKELA